MVRRAFLFALLLAIVAITGCLVAWWAGTARYRNFQAIETGWTYEQVKARLGEPTDVSGEVALVGGQFTAGWVSESDWIVVHFDRQMRVASKEFNSPEGSGLITRIRRWLGISVRIKEAA